MFDRIEIFQMATGMARHAAMRQALVARNIANADTPGYRARDLPSFAETYRTAPQLALETRRPGHMRPPAPAGGFGAVEIADDPASPNGNTVSLEMEMVRAADIRRQHELALSIYASSLNILRSSIGRK